MSASFQGKKKNREEINKEINKLKEEKNRRQPSRIKTGGSTFKNPINQTDIKVWELIKNSISTTKSFGDAKISEKHCNFLVNSKNAKFEDMMKLRGKDLQVSPIIETVCLSEVMEDFDLDQYTDFCSCSMIMSNAGYHESAKMLNNITDNTRVE